MKNSRTLIISLLIAVGVGVVTGGLFSSNNWQTGANTLKETKISWQEAERLITNCEVVGVSQTHSLKVGLALKNGQTRETTEPRIDAVINAAQAVREKCGNIDIVTE